MSINLKNNYLSELFFENLPNPAPFPGALSRVARMAMTDTMDEDTKKTVETSELSESFIRRQRHSFVIFKKIIQQLKNLKNDFYILDKNQNGVLEKHEMKNFPVIFKKNPSLLTDAQIKRVLSVVDKNEDDKMDFHEFMMYFCPK